MRKWLEYIQQLWNEVIVEDTTLLEDTEGSQITGFKHKEISPEDDIDCQPFKKAKGKQPTRYQGDNSIKMGGTNPCERCVHAGQDCLVYNSR